MDLQEIKNYYDRHPQEVSANMISVSEVFKAWIYHVLTDVYTDIPYSQSLQGHEIPRPAFDSGKDVYTALLNNLKAQL